MNKIYTPLNYYLNETLGLIKYSSYSTKLHQLQHTCCCLQPDSFVYLLQRVTLSYRFMQWSKVLLAEL